MSDMKLYRHENITGRLFSESISKDDIKEKYNQTKIGQKVLIKTIKTCEIETSNPKYQYLTKATVIAKYPRFARVKHKSGTIEDVLWVDLVMMDRVKENRE